jgi:transcriptional regulator with XRE-family HTH domain
MTDAHIGSRFDAFLEEEELLEEAQAVAVKRVIAWQIRQEMKNQRVSLTEMARRMKTSRAQLNRLLDPHSVTVQLETLQRAASVLGKKISISLLDEPQETQNKSRVWSFIHDTYNRAFKIGSVATSNSCFLQFSHNPKDTYNEVSNYVCAR